MKEAHSVQFSFQYHIDLGNNKISHILITEQSDPYVEASKFCAKESLPAILVTVLGDAMRDQMNHERTLVQQRQRKNTADGKRVDPRPEIALSDTLNTELREEGNGNLSVWLQEGSNIKRDKNNRSIDPANVFENLYNNYKEIQKKKQLSRKKSFESIPFRPQINHLSERIVLNKRKIQEEINTASQLRKSKQKTLISECPSRSKLTYTVSSFGNEPRPGSRDNVYQRSSNYLKRSEEKRKRLRESIERKLMEGCSFRPKINNTRLR